MAYVQSWNVELDGNLIFKSKGGYTHLICVAYQDILEMVGLVKKGSRKYVVRKRLPVVVGRLDTPLVLCLYGVEFSAGRRCRVTSGLLIGQVLAISWVRWSAGGALDFFFLFNHFSHTT